MLYYIFIHKPFCWLSALGNTDQKEIVPWGSSAAYRAVTFLPEASEVSWWALQQWEVCWVGWCNFLIWFLYILWSLLLFSHVRLFCDPMNCSRPGSPVHGIFQARILEWFDMSFSRGFSWPRDWTPVSCLAGGFFTTESPGKLRFFFIMLIKTFLQLKFVFIRVCVLQKVTWGQGPYLFIC